jgi:hypothetical protein
MKGRVYKLIVGDKYYIGSTTTTLNCRLNKHKYEKSRNTPLYNAIREYGSHLITIELIEEIDVETKFDLTRKEREHIILYLSNENCLNVNKPARTKEEKAQQESELKKQQRIRENALKEPKVRKKDDPEYNKKRWLEWANKNRERLREQYKEQDAKRRPHSPPTHHPPPAHFAVNNPLPRQLPPPDFV